MGDDDGVSLDLSNYELLWPATLFASEGERILRTPNSSWQDRATWLMTEALAGTTAVADFEELRDHDTPTDDFWDPWASAATGWDNRAELGKRKWFTELVNRSGELQHATVPRPYWPRRRGTVLSHDGSTPGGTRRIFARIVDEFADHGYLSETFGEQCCEGSIRLPDASEVIDRCLGIPGLWPLSPENWDEDTFYGLTEVFHDLVSRPRMRRLHADCGWHYSDFDNGPARVLYRRKINDLLRQAGLEYELAAEGEDLGRLVAVTDDARSQLVHRALTDSAPDITIRIRHAIALFRGRDTSTESKRSAIVALAGILEERRALIKEQVGKQDEGALFEIANRYDLRHRRADQRGGYDEAFLDWIFWWYLATVELTNRLITSRSSL